MDCDPETYSSLCPECKKLADTCLLLPYSKQKFASKHFLFPRAESFPLAFEIKTKKPFDELNDGAALGIQLRKDLSPWITWNPEVHRFFMWTQRNDADGKGRGVVTITVLVDIWDFHHDAIKSIQAALPRKIINEGLNVDFGFENRWALWQTLPDAAGRRISARNHAGKFRLTLFTELVQTRNVTYFWTNFSLATGNDYWVARLGEKRDAVPAWVGVGDLSHLAYRGDGGKEFI